MSGIKYLSREEAGNKLLEELLIANGLLTVTAQEKQVVSSSNCEDWLKKFVTVDAKMEEIKRRVRILQLHPDPVLITGPTGVGKEIIAHALHGAKPGPFLPLNCAGLNPNLLESDLFGHEEGSFTGANRKKIGALVAVQNGTVLLDEVDRMPLEVQSKLLRAIQEKEVRPVGSHKTEPIFCRFVFTAKHDLLEKVDSGQFLPDLYGRIMTFELKITPLKDRPHDIKPILESLGCPKEFLEIPQSFMPLVERFNVRALISYARQCSVFRTI